MAETKASASGTAFTDDERAAMKERAAEVKRSRSKAADVDGEADVLAKIAELQGEDRVMAERLHAAITAAVPELTPKTWYGMPGYAKNGKVVCFFQSAQKFKTRYATFGFNESANLDDGDSWPVAFALATFTDAMEAQIVALVKRAAG